MTWRTPGAALWDLRGNDDRYRTCIMPLCTLEASSMYQVPLCQMHLLSVWALVEEHRRQGADPAGELQEEFEARDREVEARAVDLPGWIYYLRVDQYLKIGHTKNLYRRIRQYPPNADLLASHPGSRADEQDLHRRFAAYRDSGREWYTDQPEIRAHIAAVLERYGKPDVPRPKTGRGHQSLKVPNGAFKM